jgi:hypothetical protein
MPITEDKDYLEDTDKDEDDVLINYEDLMI